MKSCITNFAYKSFWLALLLAAGIGLTENKAHANAEIVYFYNTYNNPAMMDLLTKNFEAMGGFTGTDLDFKYKGTQIGRGPGTSKSERYNFHPYGNLMYRLPSAPKWVLGFDISGPSFDNMFYKDGPAEGTKCVIRSNFYNWKISYQAFETVTLGFGIYVAHLRRANYSFQFPGVQFITKTRGAKAGWNAGFLWKFDETTFFSGSFWSRIKGFSHGHGDVYDLATGNLIASRGIKATAFEPNNFELSALKFLTKEWLVSLTGRYMIWKIRNDFTLYRMPVPTDNGVITQNLVFPLNYKNSWVISGFTKYQLDPQWAMLGAFNYNSNPQSIEFRPVIFPASWTWYTGAGAQYSPTENWMITFILGYAWSNAKIRHTPEDAVGKSKVRIPNFDLNLTYKF